MLLVVFSFMEIKDSIELCVTQDILEYPSTDAW